MARSGNEFELVQGHAEDREYRLQEERVVFGTMFESFQSGFAGVEEAVKLLMSCRSEDMSSGELTSAAVSLPSMELPKTYLLERF